MPQLPLAPRPRKPTAQDIKPVFERRDQVSQVVARHRDDLIRRLSPRVLCGDRPYDVCDLRPIHIPTLWVAATKKRCSSGEKRSGWADSATSALRMVLST